MAEHIILLCSFRTGSGGMANGQPGLTSVQSLMVHTPPESVMMDALTMRMYCKDDHCYVTRYLTAMQANRWCMTGWSSCMQKLVWWACNAPPW